LYGAERWNFPALYEQWDYAAQIYKDTDAIWESRMPETVLLSVRAFSQRYMVTDEKFGVDYNMEYYWRDKGVMDNQRTLRIMMPMTKDELFNKTSTASDTRYWVSNILLVMANKPDIRSLGKVFAPTAVMTDSEDHYYIRFSCATEGATILYNHNFISPSYTPTSPYGDTAVTVPKSFFKDGKVTMTARAVKEGCSDAGVVTLTLTSSGAEASPAESSGEVYSDVRDNSWYAPAVEYVMSKGLMDEQDKGLFAPDAPMTRAMLVSALYRAEGRPAVTSYAEFTDVAKGSPLSAAVSWAKSAGVTSGTGDGSTFSPDVSISREQIAAMFYRYAAYKKRDISAAGDLSKFVDADKIADYALDGLVWANGVKLINGDTNNRILPKDTTTRAMGAQLFKNFGSL
jgi:hypothetical protein